MALLWEKMNDGEIALGFSLALPAAAIIEHACGGWDWLWIDGQHGQHDYRSTLECVRVADACGIPPIVRVPGHDYGTIGRVLDMRPAGIMVPMIDTAEAARRVVDAVRFPPAGKRSYGGRRSIDVEGRGYFQTADERLLLVAQIETAEAVRNAGAIAATEGVDVLFFGPDDMKVRLGIPIDTSIKDSVEVADALEQTVAAAKAAGKMVGCVAGTGEVIKLAISLGCQLIAGGGDVGFLRTAAPAKLKELRGAIDSCD